MSGLTANALFGFDPAQPAPTATPVPEHVGQPEPSVARTSGRTNPADIRRPVIALVVLLAGAVLLTQFTFRGEIEVGG